MTSGGRAATGLAIVASLWLIVPDQRNILLPPLGAILKTLVQLAVDGHVLRDLSHSTERVLAGVLIALVLAGMLGLLSAIWIGFGDFLAGIVEIIRPIPPIAWTPIAIMMFGVGWPSAIAIVAISAFFPIWLGVLQGLDEIHPDHILAARCLGATKSLIISDVMIPSVTPYAVHGLRLGIGIGWFSVIAAEMVGASSGLGHAVQDYSLNLEMSKTYAYLLVIGVIGYLSSAGLRWLDSRMNRWKNERAV